METREIAESAPMSAWFSAATPYPDTSVSLWRNNPHLPRRLACGVTFDIVLAGRSLIESAYRLLARYEQPLGPAVTFTNIRSAAVLVPRGTSARWPGLMTAAQWPGRVSQPACLGRGHAILIPALAPRPTAGLVRWLVPPDDEQTIGGVPLLTSPVPLARCLTEAHAALAPRTRERTPLSRAVSAVRPVLPSPPEDVMTTTALRAPRPAHRDGEVLHQRISVVSRRGTHPRAEDALRAGSLRRITAAKLRYCGLDALVDDVMLIVSELWTNALLHSGTSEITLSIKVQDGFLHIIVDDGMPGFPVSKAADEEALSGRGLALVDALAKEHGGEWSATEDGTATWCTLALPQETAS